MLRLVININEFGMDEKFYELYLDDIEIASAQFTEFFTYAYKGKIGIEMYDNEHITFLTVDRIEYPNK